MDANARCPRCHTDLLSPFPFGFAKRSRGPASTYICTRCKFLFANVADPKIQEPRATPAHQ
jgi:DNA-directed RNA polymerase subunit RPC12/RpoP